MTSGTPITVVSVGISIVLLLPANCPPELYTKSFAFLGGGFHLAEMGRLVKD